MYVMIYFQDDSRIERVFRFNRLATAVKKTYEFTIQNGFYSEEELNDLEKMADYKAELAEEHYFESPIDDSRWVQIVKTWEMPDVPKLT